MYKAKYGQLFFNIYIIFPLKYTLLKHDEN